MEEVGGGPPGPFEDLEVIRIEAGMSTSRFCRLIDMPERTWRRWQSKARQQQPPKGPWPQPARDAARPLVTGHALAKPAWGHRKIWALTRHDGHKVSQATVLRLLRLLKSALFAPFSSMMRRSRAKGVGGPCLSR